MSSHRRWLQFSLRTAFVLLTAFGIWLGFIVNRAREQREAVEAIEALRGSMVYDWEFERLLRDGELDPKPNPRPSGPTWLRRIIGDEYFQEPIIATFLSSQSPPPESDILKAVPHLQRLRRLRQVDIFKPISDEAMSNLRTALPNCEVRSHNKF